MTIHYHDIHNRGALCGINQLSTETTEYIEKVTCDRCKDRYRNPLTKEDISRIDSFVKTSRQSGYTKRRNQ